MASNDIYATYLGRRYNISLGARNIHKALFTSTKRKASKYDKEDADLLTAFFQDYKQAANNSKSLEGVYFASLGNIAVNLPKINFNLGGKYDNATAQSGGLLFESELQKLLDKEVQNVSGKNFGQDTAFAKIFVPQQFEYNGKKALKHDNPELIAFVEKQLGTQIQNFSNEIVSKIKTQFDEETGKYDVWVRVGAQRYGKVDNVSMTGEPALVATVTGKSTPQFDRVREMLSKATFSVKSYQSQGQVHLGSTQKYKAISAIADYVGTKSARAVSLYYLHHPEGEYRGSDIKERPEQVTELYEHYNHMKDAFELSGLGLTYEDLTTASVDFLLVNRSGSVSDIQVYSVQDLLRRYNATGRFNIK